MIRLLPFALLVTLAACKETEPPAQVIRPAQVWTVQATSTAEQLRFSGDIRPRYETDLAFRVVGKVQSRNVNLGDHVQAGQILARLDTADLNLNLAAAQANLAAAQADLTHTEKEWLRLKPLYEQRFIGKSTLDGAQAARDAARARVEAAQAQMKLSGNQTRHTELKADQPGIITTTFAEAGQVVSAGQPVLHIAYDGEREAHVQVGESTARSLQTGAPVEVQPWSMPDQRLDGRVREIAPSADNTGSFLVKVSLTQAPADLRLGMSADMIVTLASQKDDSRWLPATALFQQGDQPAVWLVDESGKVKLAPVTVLAYREHGIKVSGLMDGARVIAAGVHTLSAGQAIQPMPYDGPTDHAHPSKAGS